MHGEKKPESFMITRAKISAVRASRVRRLFEGGAYLNVIPDKFTFSKFSFNGTLPIC